MKGLKNKNYQDVKFVALADGNKQYDLIKQKNDAIAAHRKNIDEMVSRLNDKITLEMANDLEEIVNQV